MSWAIGEIGRAWALAHKIETILRKQNNCVEPEETIRQEVFDGIIMTLNSMPKDVIVRITASGSQGQYDYQDPSKGVVNSLNVEVTPFYSQFVE